MEPSHQAQLIQQIPKMVKVMSRRTGRLYYKPIPMEQPSFSRATLSNSTMDHPVVIATVAAGLVGVVIVVILILTIWIRRCHSHKEDEQDEKPQTLSSFPSQVSEISQVVSGSESGCSRNSTMEIFPRSSSALSFGSQGDRRFKSSHILLTIPEITKSMNDINHEIHHEPEITQVV